MADSVGQHFGLLQQRDHSLFSGSAARRRLRCFERDGARDSIGLTSAQGQQQMASLKVGAANEIDRAQSGSDGPANVYAKEFGFRDFARVTLYKIQTAQANPQPAQNQRQQRALWPPGQTEPGSFQDCAEDLETFFDVAAHQ